MTINRLSTEIRACNTTTWNNRSSLRIGPLRIWSTARTRSNLSWTQKVPEPLLTPILQYTWTNSSLMQFSALVRMISRSRTIFNIFRKDYLKKSMNFRIQSFRILVMI